MTPLVFDDVLADPGAYRAAVLAMPRRSHTLADDVVFHGIAEAPNRLLADVIELLCPGVHVTMSCTRLSPKGQVEPNMIHTDRDLGDVTGIFFLNPDPPAWDGTTFYRHRETGAELSTAASLDEKLDEGFRWRDRWQWEPTVTVPARFNRLLLFPAAAFHSRAIFENWGEGDDARLVQLAFCTGALPCV